MLFAFITARTAAAGGAATTLAASTGAGGTAGGSSTATGSALGSIGASRASSLGTAAGGLAATTEIGGDGAGLGGLGARVGSLFESTSTATVTDGSGLQSVQGAILSGTEDMLLGDATADAIASGAGNAADTMLVAAGDAGAGVLSMLPGWLVSGGLAALASEVAFAVFAIVLLFGAGNSSSGEDDVRENVGDNLLLKGEESSDDAENGTVEVDEDNIESLR